MLSVLEERNPNFIEDWLSRDVTHIYYSWYLALTLIMLENKTTF